MKATPPKWPIKFFRWYCRKDLADAIEGDLLELYDRRLKSLGRARANWPRTPLPAALLVLHAGVQRAGPRGAGGHTAFERRWLTVATVPRRRVLRPESRDSGLHAGPRALPAGVGAGSQIAGVSR